MTPTEKMFIKSLVAFIQSSLGKQSDCSKPNVFLEKELH